MFFVPSMDDGISGPTQLTTYLYETFHTASTISGKLCLFIVGFSLT